MGRIFGTDGARGVVGRELDIQLAMNIGKAAAMVVKERCKDHKPVFAIGKDTRISSDMLEAAVIAGLCSVGADVIRLGVVATPAVAYLTIMENCDAGIMLSASHNSFEYNGIKLFGNGGYKLRDQEEEEIEEIILDKTRPYFVATHDQVGCVRDIDNAAEFYIDYIAAKAEGNFKNYRVLMDCSNGSASSTAREIFSKIGVQFDIISGTPDGININANCGSTHTDRLSKQVVAGGYDMGFAFDGDADRFLAVDSEGRLLDGDRLLAICSRYLMAQGRLAKNSVAVTTMSNMGFMKLMKELGVTVHTTKVGDRYVLEEMRSKGLSIGGEQSGHLIFLEHSTTGDGQLSAVMLLNAMAYFQKPLKELHDMMEKFPQVLLSVKATDEMKATLWENRELSRIIGEYEERLADSGRVLIRVSGTEPVIRVMVEGEDPTLIEEIAHNICKDIVRELA